MYAVPIAGNTAVDPFPVVRSLYNISDKAFHSYLREIVCQPVNVPTFSVYNWGTKRLSLRPFLGRTRTSSINSLAVEGLKPPAGENPEVLEVRSSLINPFIPTVPYSGRITGFVGLL